METEDSIIEGGGSQTMPTRWGDYAALQVDPSDDCTFWYLNQYEQVTGGQNWTTHIGSFAFTGCGGGAPAVTLVPASLKWGKVVVHTTGGVKKVVLTNTGSAPLNISTIATTGDFALVAVKQTKKIIPCLNGGTVALELLAR